MEITATAKNIATLDNEAATEIFRPVLERNGWTIVGDRKLDTGEDEVTYATRAHLMQRLFVKVKPEDDEDVLLAFEREFP